MKARRCFLPLCALLLAVVLLAGGCGDAAPAEREPGEKAVKGEITIGSKSLTEQYLLMKMTALLLKEEGYRVNEMVFLDSPSIRQAMESQVVDLYWEYTSTARLYYHKQEPIFDPDEAFSQVAETDSRQGIVWLARSDFNSSWALLMRKSMSERTGIATISDLAEYMRDVDPDVRFATNDEYLKREDGPSRLQQVYGIQLTEDRIIAVESDLLTQAVRDGRVDVAVGMASDPRIETHQLMILEDDKQLFPPYHAAPVVLARTLREHAEIADIMQRLIPFITDENMRNIMVQVDILQKDITNTARNFLVEHGLLKS